MRDFARTVLAFLSAAMLVATPAALVSCADSHDLAYADLRRIEPVQGDAKAGAQKAAVCAACHGADGIPVAPIFPRLAGQRADYLYHRLLSFHHAQPKDPYYSVSPMTAMAANLSDVDMRDLATYYSVQVPHPAAPAPGPAAGPSGKLLYLLGDPVRGIPPCQGCHGADADGVAVVVQHLATYPSLRGQSGAYLVARLTHYRDGQPADTSNTFIMAGVARTLDDEAISAVSGWLSSLPPGPGP